MILPPDHEAALAELSLEPPPRIYKFMSWAHLEPLLKGRGLHFQSPSEFNDPFDCSPRVVVPQTRAAIQLRLKQDRERVRGGGDESVADETLNRLRRLSPKQLKFAALMDWHQMVSGYGMTCFAEQADHPLMWSHYADSHRGVCVEFDPSALPKGQTYLTIKVIYRDHRADFHFPKGKRVDRRLDVLRVLNTKGRTWEHEKEWRIVRMSGADTTVVLPANAITSVILGARSRDQDRERLSGWLSEGFPEARVVEASLDLDGFSISVPLEKPGHP